jgi:hypothetical protein
MCGKTRMSRFIERMDMMMRDCCSPPGVRFPGLKGKKLYAGGAVSGLSRALIFQEDKAARRYPAFDLRGCCIRENVISVKFPRRYLMPDV